MSHKLILGKTGSGKSFLTKSDIEKEPRVIVYDVIGEYTNGIVCDNLKDFAELLDKRFDSSFRLIYRPLDPPGEFDFICELVYACYDLVFVVEEVDTFSVNSISLPFANIIQRGRHKNVNLWGISQRPYRVNRTLSSQCKQILCFKMTEPRDVDYIKYLMGEEPSEAVRELGQYQYVNWTGDGVTWEIEKR
jgi:DNA helicase HerA-like ATPase